MGRKRQSADVTGKDMAHRCYDATLSFLLQTVPLTPPVRECVASSLAARWVPTPNSPAPTAAPGTATHASSAERSVPTTAYSYAATSAAAAAELDSRVSKVDAESSSSGGVGAVPDVLGPKGEGNGTVGMSAALSTFFEGVRRSPEEDDLAGPGHGCLIAKDFEP